METILLDHRSQRRAACGHNCVCLCVNINVVSIGGLLQMNVQKILFPTTVICLVSVAAYFTFQHIWSDGSIFSKTSDNSISASGDSQLVIQRQPNSVGSNSDAVAIQTDPAADALKKYAQVLTSMLITKHY
ncbi:MAG: hypothetical protein HC782_03720 [Gammaproteobacteria bacterium]|nr:hypothetical protein [Gammaproteobacteria bacterium]